MLRLPTTHSCTTPSLSVPCVALKQSHSSKRSLHITPRTAGCGNITTRSFKSNYYLHNNDNKTIYTSFMQHALATQHLIRNVSFSVNIMKWQYCQMSSKSNDKSNNINDNINDNNKQTNDSHGSLQRDKETNNSNNGDGVLYENDAKDDEEGNKNRNEDDQQHNKQNENKDGEESIAKDEKEERRITGVFTTSYIVQCLIVGALIIAVWELTSGGRRKQEGKVDLNNMKITDQVYMDVAVDDDVMGRIVIGLFGEAAPKTVKNFIGLCTRTEDGYKGTEFHKVLDGCVQGGDVEHSPDRKGGKSIYGGYFGDENLKIPHFPYAVAMANKGPNSNASQFYFATRSNKELDRKHVVFGIVLKGKEIVDEMERSNTDKTHRPLWPITIASCGTLTNRNSKANKSVEK